MNTIKKLALLGAILSIGVVYGMDQRTVEVEEERELVAAPRDYTAICRLLIEAGEDSSDSDSGE